MNAYERAQLLERVNREGATIGAAIPEDLTVDGERLPLRSVVIDLVTEADATAASDRRHGAITALRRERTHRFRRLQSEELDRDEAEALASSIVGIDRALEVLTADDSSVEEAATARERADRERWMTFLRKALGMDAGRDRRRY